jgi:hypothetical protein
MQEDLLVVQEMWVHHLVRQPLSEHELPKGATCRLWKATVDNMWLHPHMLLLNYQHLLAEHAVHKRQAAARQKMMAAQTIFLWLCRRHLQIRLAWLTAWQK